MDAEKLVLEPGSKVYGSFEYDGRTGPVVNLFDADGEPVDDIAKAVSGVGCMSQDEWVSFPIDDSVQIQRVS